MATLSWAAPAPSPVYDAKITAAQGQGIGEGRTNTAAILDVASVDPATNAPAAHACNTYTGGGKNDWFLPSRGELNELYKYRVAFGGFSPDDYWSSSQDSGSYWYAWCQNFVNTNGSQRYDNKSRLFKVRAVRSF